MSVDEASRPSGDQGRTAFVLAYSLSINPSSQVLTEYLRTVDTTFSTASLPPPVLGSTRLSSFDSSSGGYESTRATRDPDGLMGCVRPLTLDATESSADLMKGLIKLPTAFIS